MLAGKGSGDLHQTNLNNSDDIAGLGVTDVLNSGRSSLDYVALDQGAAIERVGLRWP
jgi:hypothetical protein